MSRRDEIGCQTKVKSNFKTKHLFNQWTRARQYLTGVTYQLVSVAFTFQRVGQQCVSQLFQTGPAGPCVFDDPTNLVIDEPISAFVCSNFHRYLLLPTAAIRFPTKCDVGLWFRWIQLITWRWLLIEMATRSHRGDLGKWESLKLNWTCGPSRKDQISRMLAKVKIGSRRPADNKSPGNGIFPFFLFKAAPFSDKIANFVGKKIHNFWMELNSFIKMWLKIEGGKDYLMAKF